MNHASSWSVGAAAKINLFLHILKKRRDNYHDIESLMVSVDVADGLTLTLDDNKRGEISLVIAGEEGSYLQKTTEDENNLVVRAAHFFCNHHSCDILSSYSLRFSLDKIIPQGAGLGGGSSDAAATIRLLQKAFQHSISLEKTKELGKELGADVPFCLHGTAAWVTGLGDILTPISFVPPLYVILLYPDVSVLTSVIFKSYRQSHASQSIPLPPSDFISWLKAQQNHLEEQAISEFPVIQKALDYLEAQPDCLLARMSGSGSCCFALFDRKEDAITASQAIQKEESHWWIKVAPLLERPMPILCHS